MVLLGNRVVEEDHHPVAGEVLERPAVVGDGLAHHAVVLAQQRHQLLRIRPLGKGREAAQVAERDGDLAPMSRQQLFAIR